MLPLIGNSILSAYQMSDTCTKENLRGSYLTQIIHNIVDIIGIDSINDLAGDNNVTVMKKAFALMP